MWKLRRSKYGNQRVVIDGISFPSEKEGYRWRELKLMEAAGEIQDLKRQVPFELIPSQKYTDPRTGKKKSERAIKYVADFTYTDTRTGEKVVEDVKGKKTPVYELKRKMMLWFHGIMIKET